MDIYDETARIICEKGWQKMHLEPDPEMIAAILRDRFPAPAGTRELAKALNRLVFTDYCNNEATALIAARDAKLLEEAAKRAICKMHDLDLDGDLRDLDEVGAAITGKGDQ